MKLINLLSFAALAATGFAAAILPKHASSGLERGEANFRLCPAKCSVIVSNCINRDLLGLDTCQQIKCQDRDCAKCDSKCEKTSPSSVVMASEVEQREVASENNSDDELELAESMNPLMQPSCPKYCVGNRQACKEKGHKEAECNRQGCNGLCLSMCGWCDAFRAPPPRIV